MPRKVFKLPVHMYHQIMSTIIWIHIHDVIDDVTRSQNRSNFEIDISPSIFELQRRSKAQNVGNAHGYLSGLLTSGITSGKKVCHELKMAAIFKILKYQTQLQFDLRYENIFPNYAKKGIFMMMTSSMTSQGGLKVGPLYSFINEITTFFMITKQRAKISSLNLLCICIIRLWLQLYEYIFMTSFMTSASHKIGQILKLIYFHQYLSCSVDQKLKMSEMLMAIFLVYSASGITSGKKSLSGSKWRPFWKFWNIKHSFNLTSDMKRSSQIMPKKFFMVMTS